MKISVISTVKNEEGDIRVLLDSILDQSRKPDEIVIVDGGSKDKTYEVLKHYREKYPMLKVTQVEGNIAKGRNQAISMSEGDIIAQIDGGCVAHPKWLERITSPFSKDADLGLVAGFYVMTGDNPLQLAVAPYHGVTPQRFDPRNFMPSGRSVAFRKWVWERVGGYSEELQWAGEDTLFNYKVIKEGIKIARVPEAYVYWEVPSDFGEIAKKFYRYSLGDAQTGIWWHPAQNLNTHNIKILTVYIRYLLAFVLLFFATLNAFFFYVLIVYISFYVFASIWKHIDEVKDTQARLLVPVVQILSDFCVMAGFLSGVLKRKKNSA